MTKLDPVQEELKNLNHNLIRLNSKQSFGRIFLTGIISGLGSAVGATLIVAILLYLLSKVELIPIIGSWLSNLVGEIMANLPNF